MVKTRNKSKISSTAQETFSIEELARLAGERIKENYTKPDSNRSLPDILLLEKGTSVVRQKAKAYEISSTFDTTGIELPSIEQTYCKDPHEELMKKSIITSDFEKRECAPPMFVSRHKAYKLRKAERERSTGQSWFDMRAPEMTTELKNDLKILQMRGTLDRTHYYKSSDWKKKLPKHFQIGTVIEGPGEFYSSRIPKRQRKRTIVAELLADDKFRKYQKLKYNEFQKRKQLANRRKRKPKK